MTGILLAKSFVANYGRQLDEVARRIGIKPEVLHLPDDPQARMSQADCDRIELTMQTRDVPLSATNILRRAEWLERQRAAKFWTPWEKTARVTFEEFSAPPSATNNAAAPREDASTATRFRNASEQVSAACAANCTATRPSSAPFHRACIWRFLPSRASPMAGSRASSRSCFATARRSTKQRGAGRIARAIAR